MFWQNYTNLCKEAGKAPNVVAAEVGIKSSGTVTGWRNGAIPRASVLSKIAEYFGISVCDLIGEQQKKPAPEGGDGLNEKQRIAYERLVKLTPENLEIAIGQLDVLLTVQEKRDKNRTVQVQV